MEEVSACARRVQNGWCGTRAARQHWRARQCRFGPCRSATQSRAALGGALPPGAQLVRERDRDAPGSNELEAGFQCDAFFVVSSGGNVRAGGSAAAAAGKPAAH